MRRHLSRIVLFLIVLLAGREAMAARGIALVIGEAAYAAWPALPTCAASAAAMSKALTATGYTVLGGSDLSNGPAKAAIISYVKMVGLHPSAPTFVYVCSYGTSFDARFFAVPVGAGLERDGDVLTQGVAVRGLINLSEAGLNPGFSVIDLYPLPGRSLEGIGPFVAGLFPREGRMVGAVVEQRAGDGPTPLATALVAALKPGLDTAAFVTAVRQGMSRLGDVGLFVAGTASVPLADGEVGTNKEWSR